MARGTGSMKANGVTRTRVSSHNLQDKLKQQISAFDFKAYSQYPDGLQRISLERLMKKMLQSNDAFENALISLSGAFKHTDPHDWNPHWPGSLMNRIMNEHVINTAEPTLEDWNAEGHISSVSYLMLRSRINDIFKDYLLAKDSGREWAQTKVRVLTLSLTSQLLKTDSPLNSNYVLLDEIKTRTDKIMKNGQQRYIDFDKWKKLFDKEYEALLKVATSVANRTEPDYIDAKDHWAHNQRAFKARFWDRDSPLHQNIQDSIQNVKHDLDSEYVEYNFREAVHRIFNHQEQGLFEEVLFETTFLNLKDSLSQKNTQYMNKLMNEFIDPYTKIKAKQSLEDAKDKGLVSDTEYKTLSENPSGYMKASLLNQQDGILWTQIEESARLSVLLEQLDHIEYSDNKEVQETQRRIANGLRPQLQERLDQLAKRETHRDPAYIKRDTLASFRDFSMLYSEPLGYDVDELRDLFEDLQIDRTIPVVAMNSFTGDFYQESALRSSLSGFVIPDKRVIAVDETYVGSEKTTIHELVHTAEPFKDFSSRTISAGDNLTKQDKAILLGLLEGPTEAYCQIICNDFQDKVGKFEKTEPDDHSYSGYVRVFDQLSKLYDGSNERFYRELVHTPTPKRLNWIADNLSNNGLSQKQNADNIKRHLKEAFKLHEKAYVAMTNLDDDTSAKYRKAAEAASARLIQYLS